MLRGELTARVAVLEAARRVRTAKERRAERGRLATLNDQPARLREEFARIRAADLLAHFRSRLKPRFLPGFEVSARSGALQQELFPDETARLIEAAHRIVNDHCWPLLGFGEKCFGQESIEWNRDPLSGFNWPLDFHADIQLVRNDGSDARVLWELNRLAHLITLGQVYAITNDEVFSREFFQQLRGWRLQNPVARGVNWNCAMEVALRSMNLLAAFSLFLRAPQMDELTLKELLQTFDQHGAHIRRNLEFSHIATSNHYLADVTGLLWIGVMLPELEAAEEWREFGLRELRREIDKQTLPDGADYEASTGYHRLKVELYLYSAVLCHLNGIEIEEKYRTKLRAMVAYMAAYLRPEGRAPLIGDTDSGQALPIERRRADDHGYLMAIGAAIFQEPGFALPNPDLPPELLWILGEQGLRDYQSLPDSPMPGSQKFADAGIYVLRQDDLYLLLNASESGVNGRGSHGHNDALSLEVSAAGVSFIVDPGTYIYTGDLPQRHLFRSTAYHSTVEVDGAEQNTIDQSIPFIIGNEARPRVLTWTSNAEADFIVAEHYGYQRLADPVRHRRSVRFDKRRRFWLIADELTGAGTHEFAFRFHFAPGLDVTGRPDGTVVACDKITGARLIIVCQQPDGEGERAAADEPAQDFVLETQSASFDYGQKLSSISACWTVRAAAPVRREFALLPLTADEDEANARDTLTALLTKSAAL